MILSVDLVAEWRDKDFRPTVNVGNRVRVIALFLDVARSTRPVEWLVGSSAMALIVRNEYIGSSHHPMVDTFTEWVPFEALRISVDR